MPKIDRKQNAKASKVFLFMRKRLKSISNKMRIIQKCFLPSENAKINSKYDLKPSKFCSSTRKRKQNTKVSKVFSFIRKRSKSISNSMRMLQNVFVHPKTLKIKRKYDLKPSKLFSSIQKRFKSKANSMQRLQKCFCSCENA